MPTQESINRKEFLMKMGFGGAALMTVLTACKNTTDAVLPSGGITVDLTTNLKTVGSSMTTNGIVIARTATANYVAVSNYCPAHGQNKVAYNSGASDFVCSHEGATYNLQGQHISGPGSAGITVYKTSVSGTTLTVTS